MASLAMTNLSQSNLDRKCLMAQPCGYINWYDFSFAARFEPTPMHSLKSHFQTNGETAVDQNLGTKRIQNWSYWVFQNHQSWVGHFEQPNCGSPCQREKKAFRLLESHLWCIFDSLCEWILVNTYGNQHHGKPKIAREISSPQQAHLTSPDVTIHPELFCQFMNLLHPVICIQYILPNWWKFPVQPTYFLFVNLSNTFWLYIWVFEILWASMHINTTTLFAQLCKELITDNIW